RSTEDFDIGATLSVGPSPCDLDPLTRRLVADAGPILRRITGLPIYLHSALALIFERHDQIVFFTTPQHAHVPAPVEHDGLQVLCAGCRSVLLRAAASASATAALSASAARAGSPTTLGRSSRRR